MSYHNIVELFDASESPSVRSRVSSESGSASFSIGSRFVDLTIACASPILFEQIAEHATQCASILRERAAVTVPCNPPVEAEIL